MGVVAIMEEAQVTVMRQPSRPLPLRYVAAGLSVLLPALAHAAEGDPPAAPTAPQAPAAQPSPPEGPPATRETLEAGSAFRTLGLDVKGPSGIVVAQLVNILVNAEGQPVAAILDYGGFLGVGKRRIAVAWRVLRFTREGIELGLSREQLRGFPDFKESEPAVLAVPPEGTTAAETPANR
jgi:hypothetical protein